MTIQKFGVVGAGQMGNGIAHVAALSGLQVVLHDVKQEFVDRGMATISKNLDRAVKKEKITEAEKQKILSAITSVTELSALKDCDLVVEAVTENLEVKKKVFTELDASLKDSALLASNTSSISITKMAAWTKRPDKFIGMHFMNPVPVMKLVEVIRGYDTSDTTYALVKALAEQMGKVPVEVNDYPGFVSNRVLMPMINEAIFCVMENVGKPEAIDAVMKLGMNHPMGPLALADFIGLDTCLAIMEVLHSGLGDSKYRPCPLLRKMVAAGHFGKKSGRGFYTYDN